jgi:hypothetical protein
MTGFSSLLYVVQIGGDELAALVEVLDVRAGFLERQQDVIALDGAEELFADRGYRPRCPPVSSNTRPSRSSCRRRIASMRAGRSSIGAS